MPDFGKLKQFHYAGPLSAILTDFLLEKRATGCVYNTEGLYMTMLDRMSAQLQTPPDTLPKELVDAWTSKRESESYKTLQNRVIVIRKLAGYMQAHDYPAYMTPVVLPKRQSDFVPHIYTNDELGRIFTAADKCPTFENCPNRGAVASLLFRTIYCCGLRLSEALRLRMQDVDLQQGVLTIWDSKFGASRLVPMSEELTARCCTFHDNLHLLSEPTTPFFPSPAFAHYSKRSAAHMFRQILHLAKIPYLGEKKGPRIHDLRHTFAVNCLKNWVREGKDLTSAFPFLSAYLGHKDLKGTQEYLRLTAEMFPNITKAIEVRFGDLIPNGGVLFEAE